MRFSYVHKINIKKLRTYRGKSLFLIAPIVLLMSLGIVISSQAANIQSASEQTIFGTAAESGRLIALSTQQAAGGITENQGIRMIFGGDATYNDGDLDTVRSIPYVDSASLPTRLPITRITSDTLFSGKIVSFNDVRTLDSAVVGQYTDQSFAYTPGEPIPIVLSASSFIESYEDWGGQTEITIDIGGTRRGGDPSVMTNDTPFKFAAIPYDRNALIGTEFTIDFGGFDPVQKYEQEFTGTGMLFRALSDEDIQTKEEQRAADIGVYWDYAALSTPLTYTFRVAGVLEDSADFTTYVPSAFGEQVMRDYIQHQLDARTDIELDIDLLNSTFVGLTFDGLELRNSGIGGVGSFRMGNVRPGMGAGAAMAAGSASDSGESYTIPGLVITTERTEGDTDAFQQRVFGSTADATGISTHADVFADAVHSSDTILIRVDDITHRARVVTALNDAGYAYQDFNDLQVFAELQSTLDTVTTIVTASFVILTAIIIILTMGKFVSDSRKEIGVYRALGATRGNIRQLFMSQAILYTMVGYIIGAVIGGGLVLVLAKPVQLWFDSFIDNTIQETFAVVHRSSTGVFTGINWEMFGVYSLLLIVIAITVSIIPATRASRVSPVQAIKND